jgi:hypothetical protein
MRARFGPACQIILSQRLGVVGDGEFVGPGMTGC